MHNKKIIIILTLIAVVSIFSINNYRQRNSKRIIENDFYNFQDSFVKTAQYLSDYNYPIIYVSREDIINDNREQTINSIVSKELFEKPYGICLENLGYTKFIKNGGIYFVKRIDMFGVSGIMFYPTGFLEEYDGLVTDFTELSDGWYYYFAK